MSSKTAVNKAAPASSSAVAAPAPLSVSANATKKENRTNPQNISLQFSSPTTPATNNAHSSSSSSSSSLLSTSSSSLSALENCFAALQTASPALRFELELEFVECLSNPQFLQHLASSSYFHSAAFTHFIGYLQYWRFFPYVKYISRPYCLFVLEHLNEPAFRHKMAENDFIQLLHTQQFHHWFSYRYQRYVQQQQKYEEAQSAFMQTQNTNQTHNVNTTVTTTAATAMQLQQPSPAPPPTITAGPRQVDSKS